MRIIRFIDADDAVRWGLEAEGIKPPYSPAISSQN